MPATPCPGPCTSTRAAGHLLCQTCWHELPESTRRKLGKRGAVGMKRVRSLHDQLRAGKALRDIRID
ncbi:hypothetical protein VSR01_10660 [Actinacidiphila sp. DG2A-62]|uniref:hypothetical protein n=1 Tax=Actinacidiphila sp. DG2A-62 TaxID=3108821 RepID=UPI002DBD6FF6|nr:hypothetical protein [Actinacidiphila sp. DG2A-62]MEC3993979.1 hypothetical protein [Actinacidiphila sp. DG2A-62]